LKRGSREDYSNSDGLRVYQITRTQKSAFVIEQSDKLVCANKRLSEVKGFAQHREICAALSISMRAENSGVNNQSTQRIYDATNLTHGNEHPLANSVLGIGARVPGSIPSLGKKGYVTVEGGHTLGIVFPIPKGRQLHIIAALASGLFFQKANMGHSNNYCPNGPNRKKIEFNY